MLFTQVPGGATAWTPEVADCLVPGGRYAWFVRAVLDPDIGEASEWSAPRLFTVAAAPSVEEVEQALSVLVRYVEQGSEPGDPEDRALTGLASSAAARLASRSVQNGTAAIRGEQPDPSGETYGVVGISASPDGAGVGVANTGGGPDLVLDGTADGVTDTELSESGINRRSTSAETFAIETIGTTLSRTVAGEYGVGSRVNLERSMILGGRLDGHLVQGHVDGVGRLLSVRQEGYYWLLDFQIPEIVEEVTILHGSITINGVSLTVNKIPAEGECQVGIIPFTWKHTNRGSLKPGDSVNLEGDLVGKYVAKLLSAWKGGEGDKLKGVEALGYGEELE